MPLDDFFAKREKKKTKKKQNPESLMKELVSDPKTSKSNESGTNLDSSKLSSLLKDDEWEAIDDGEKEIDLESIRISKLSVGVSEDQSKGAVDQPDDGIGSTEGAKKVWGLKPTDTTVTVDEEPAPPAVEPQSAPRVYVPVHLRMSATKAPTAAKPDVGSESDFPTLDVAAAAAAVPAGATNTTTTKSPIKISGIPGDDGEGWEQAGAPRKAIRLPDDTPPVNPAPSAYVPPSLRQSLSTAPQHNLEPRAPRFSEDRIGGGRSSNYDGFVPRTSSNFGGGGGWARGSTISNNPQNPGLSNPGPFAPKAPVSSTTGSTGWERSSHTKTFRDMGREKNEFELVQSNRFAGLSGL